jgi:predicted alpha/beta superfamily hydrolase
MSILLLLASLVAGPQPDTFTIESKILGQTRRVFVHLPQSYAKSAQSRRYPTIVVFDGRYVMEPVVMMSDILSRNGQMPESVIVAIENTDDYDGRVHDLTPPGLSVSGSGLNEGGDRFLDFIEKELLPALDEKFRAGAPRALVGLSSGGILVTYAAATRDAFRLNLALDTPTHLGDGFLGAKLLQRAKARPAPPVRYVSINARFGWKDDVWKNIAAAAPQSWLLYND